MKRSFSNLANLWNFVASWNTTSTTTTTTSTPTMAQANEETTAEGKQQADVCIVTDGVDKNAKSKGQNEEQAIETVTGNNEDSTDESDRE